MIAVVVALSTVMMVVALGLLAESSGPFDRAYDRQGGAHLVATFDRAKAPDAQLTDLARRVGASAVAGPFGQVALDVTLNPGRPPASLTVVGRDGPGGPVDRLNVWQGRWPTKLGEIVLNENPANFGPARIGTLLAVSERRSLTVVGFAYSVSESADAWVTPEQMSDLRPTTTQMLYRFAHAATDAQMASATTAVAAGSPPESLLGSRSYLALRAKAVAATNTFLPFLVVFGCLALAVAVLIVANVVSGAVVAGFRHIGVLKALGFTPAQVLTVYLTMALLPALTGCMLGTVLGDLAARSLLTSAFRNYGSGGIGVAGWVHAATLVGVPAVVALSALLPALRARSLSATEAISAGSAPRSGRGLRIQRWLASTRLPRAASLGLGVPFARPARSALTMAAVVLGVASVTFAIGLASTVTTYQTAQGRSAWVQVQVFTGPNPGIPRAPRLTDTEVESMLRSLPGTTHVTASADVMVRPMGGTETFLARFYRGDTTSLGYELVDGHWPAGPGEVVVSERFLRQRGFAVGETLTVDADGRQQTVRIVGKVLMNSANMVLSNWETLALVAPGTRATSYEVGLGRGTDTSAFLTAVKAGDPGLDAVPANDADSFIAVMFGIVTVLALMLGTVAALGVFNTVVLNTRERRRDLGMLKSIGMTPRQVVLMMVISMAALGAVGSLLGIPLGVVMHRLALPAIAHAAQLVIPDRMLHIYHPPVLALLALAGIGIAAFGAFLPARFAARLTIAEALHNE
ncbi:ABC transporter permease [Micromonospora sp. KC723]|nr:ABC transporter permease [Micromonospora sp. KC723]